MIKYIIQRFMYMFFVFIILSVVLFGIFSMVPGDAARAEVEPYKEKATPEAYQMMYEKARERLGLDDPLYVRYFKWANNFAHGDLGQSTKHRKPVAELIGEPLKITIFYNIFVITVSLMVTIPLGIYCAIRKNSLFDKFTQVFTVIGYSIPSYVYALIFIFFFSVKLRIFPISGMNTPGFTGTGFSLFLDTLYHLALPIIVLTFANLGYLTRYVRASMIDALSMECIRTARAKGVKEQVVILSHAWRNALLPIVTMLISIILSVFGGAMILETMFNVNGMGKFMYDSLVNQDWNVTMAMNLFYVIISLGANLITDLTYGIVDPRVRVTK